MPLPAVMTAWVTSPGVAIRLKSDHWLLPGTTLVAPTSAVKSVTANMQLIVTSNPSGRFIVRQLSASRCSA